MRAVQSFRFKSLAAYRTASRLHFPTFNLFQNTFTGRCPGTFSKKGKLTNQCRWICEIWISTCCCRFEIDYLCGQNLSTKSTSNDFIQIVQTSCFPKKLLSIIIIIDIIIRFALYHAIVDQSGIKPKWSANCFLSETPFRVEL